MHPISGRYKQGHVELDQTVDWADGLRVTVTPENRVDGPPCAEAGFDGDVQPVEEQLMRLDAIEPFELTADEEHEIKAARAAVKAASLSAVQHRMDRGR